MNDVKKDPNELGALWVKSSSRGEFMTGTILGQPVVVFRNDRKKEGSKQPDWRVLKAQPKDEDAPARRSRPDDDFPV